MSTATSGRWLALVAPLRHRRFALLWSGLTVSLVGDGIYMVALAWQVYQLSNVPTALAVAGVVLTIPQVIFVLVSGVLSDRLDRRHMIIAADVLRGGAVGLIGALSIAHALALWHVWALVFVYGIGESLFAPAFGAIVPELVPPDLLVGANALHRFVRPLAYRLAGPAVGGLLVAQLGAGSAFVIDAVSFGASTAAMLLMGRTGGAPGVRKERHFWRELAEGTAYARSQTWLATTLIGAAVVQLLFWGPYQVLLPFLVKNDLGGGADGLGLVLAAGGVGGLITPWFVSWLGMPRRPMPLIYLLSALVPFCLVGFGLATLLWHAAAASLVLNGANSAAAVLAGALLQRMVPARLLGRVSSLDTLMTFSLVPASYALTGVLSGLLGIRTTLLTAGVLTSAFIVALLAVRKVRDLDVTAAEPAAVPAS